jgi:hypothetical protein
MEKEGRGKKRSCEGRGKIRGKNRLRRDGEEGKEKASCINEVVV